jgi:hypothetical protein
MSLAAFIFRTIRWSAWDGCAAGLEHADIRPADGGLDISGVVIGHQDSARFGLSYRLKLDALWRTREAHLRTTAGGILHLESNGQGSWHENGKSQPLTNTLPIRRLDMKAGESIEIRLCYVAVPDLTVSPASQRYTALASGVVYRFESLDSGFTAELPVDGDGFVLDYPGMFKRMD